jgi:hypothetical protein
VVKCTANGLQKALCCFVEEYEVQEAADEAQEQRKKQKGKNEK